MPQRFHSRKFDSQGNGCVSHHAGNKQSVDVYTIVNKEAENNVRLVAAKIIITVELAFFLFWNTLWNIRNIGFFTNKGGNVRSSP